VRAEVMKIALLLPRSVGHSVFQLGFLGGMGMDARRRVGGSTLCVFMASSGCGLLRRLRDPGSFLRVTLTRDRNRRGGRRLT
jgi:hypothetical protein